MTLGKTNKLSLRSKVDYRLLSIYCMPSQVLGVITHYTTCNSQKIILMQYCVCVWDEGSIHSLNIKFLSITRYIRDIIINKVVSLLKA